MTIKITRTEFSAEELRRKAGRVRYAGQSRRLLAPPAVMDRQTLRDWVHRYNAEGVEGLRDWPGSGRKPRLKVRPASDSTESSRRSRTLHGLRVRWRCVGLL